MNIIRYNPVNSLGVAEKNAKYLPKDVFLKCFKDGELLHIDKTIAGSGMSHSFLNMLPKRQGSINILIAPNRQVVLSKEESYHKNKSSFLTDIQFFCSGSKDSILLKKTNVVVITTDTCLKMFDELSNRDKEYILIDEYHSTIQGSLYRKSLRGFLDIIKDSWLKKGTSISTVSATPLLFSDVDVTLIPTSYNMRYDIICNDNYKSVIDEAKHYINNTEESVIVFTNSIRVISHFATKNSEGKLELKADLKTGSKLLETICKKFLISNNPKFIIGSSQAFEGFDIQEPNIRVYFFQDLDNDSEDSFNAGNIYQAINRTRNGYNSATYCKSPKREVLSSIEGIIHKIKNSKVSSSDWGTYSKLSKVPNLTHEDRFRFLKLLNVKRTHLGCRYSINKDLLDLEREKEVMINKGLFASEYSGFLRNRNINLISSKEVSKTIKMINTRQTEYYCYVNRDLILEHKLNERFFSFKVPSDYHKDSTLDKILSSFLSQYKEHLCYINYMQYEDKSIIYATQKQMQILDNASNGILKGFLERLKDSYRLDKKEELRALRNSPTRKAELIDKIQRYEKNIYAWALSLIGILSNEEYIFPENYVGNRDYNLLTKINIDTIVEICSFVGVSVREFDIKSCAPRVIYASVGLELPSDFYGENKVNKDKINTLLNLISNEHRGSNTESRHKANLRYNLKSLGFDSMVISFLLREFYNREKGAIFQYYTFHEMNICNNVNDWLFNGVGVRRHDSIILFDSLFPSDDLDKFRYLGQRGWFIAQAKTEKLITNNQLKLEI